MSYGMKTNLAVSFQNSYGTANVASRYWIPFVSEGFSVIKAPLVSNNMSGIFDEGATYEGANTVEGKVETEAHPITLGVFLKAMMGNPTSVNSGSIYTHTFKPRVSDFDDFAANHPLTITKDLGDTGSSHQYYDMVASKLTIHCAYGELLKCGVTFKGGKYSQLTAPSASFPTGKSWTWDVASVQLAGASNGNISNLSFDLDEPMADKFTLNNAKTPSRTKRSGHRILSIGGTMVFDNQTEYQQFLAQAERNLTVNFVGPTQIQSGYYESLTMEVPLFRYTDYKVVAGGPGKIEVGFSGKGVYSVSSANLIKFTLVNTQPAF